MDPEPGGLHSGQVARRCLVELSLSRHIGSFVIGSIALVTAVSCMPSDQSSDSAAGRPTAMAAATPVTASDRHRSASAEMLTLRLDTTAPNEIHWLPSPRGARAGPVVITEAVILNDGSIAIFVAADSSIALAGSDGRFLKFSQVVGDSGRVLGARARLHTSPVSGGLVAFSVADRRIHLLDAQMQVAAEIPVRVARQFPTLSVGVLNSGAVVLAISREKAFESDSIFRRMYDIAVVQRSGSMKVVRSGIKGAYEMPPRELLIHRPSLDPQRVVQLRYASRERYFTFVAAGADRIYAVSGQDSVTVLTEDGEEVGQWVRSVRASAPVPPSDSTMNDTEVIPLGMRVDAEGRLWLERPRHERTGVSEWDILGTDGRQVAQFAAPEGCRLMAIGREAALCQFRATDQLAAPRFLAFRFAEN